MPTSGVDYNTRTKEQLIELIEMIQRDRYRIKEENKKLKEKVKKLEERLDNKEKVNKQLREELGKFVMKS